MSIVSKLKFWFKVIVKIFGKYRVQNVEYQLLFCHECPLLNNQVQKFNVKNLNLSMNVSNSKSTTYSSWLQHKMFEIYK